jgi:hypothetical protein
MFRAVVDELSKQAAEDAYAEQEPAQVQAATEDIPPPAPAPAEAPPPAEAAPTPAPAAEEPIPTPTAEEAATSAEASASYGAANLPADIPPPAPEAAPAAPQYTPEQEAWLAQPDPYRPVADLLGTVLGTKYNMPADINQAYLNAEQGYATGTPQTAWDKGTGTIQTLVDLEHSALGQAGLGLIRRATPTIFAAPRIPSAYAK